MKKIVVAIVVAAIAAPMFAVANEDQNAEFLETCKTYAKEDGVEQADLQEYLDSCIKDLQEAAKDK